MFCNSEQGRQKVHVQYRSYISITVLILCMNNGLHDALVFHFCTAAKVNLNLAENRKQKYAGSMNHLKDINILF